MFSRSMFYVKLHAYRFAFWIGGERDMSFTK